MKHFTIFVLSAVLFLSAFHVPKAQAFEFPDYLSMWFPQWFGEHEDGPDPGETLRAPFAENSTKTFNPGENIGVPYRFDPDVNLNDLSKPHRSHKQVGAWLTRAIAEVTTIDPDPTLMKVHFNRLKTGMNDFAIKSYKQFLSDYGIVNTLRQGKMTLNSVVDGDPLLLNEGVVEGRYRWLFQVPLTMTYVPDGRKSMKSPDISNQTVTLVVQVGHVSGGVKGKAIETWQVKSISEKIYPNR